MYAIQLDMSSIRSLVAQLRSDFRLHGGEWTNLAYYPVANYRFGRWASEHESAIVRAVGGKTYGALRLAIEIATGTVIHREAKIGKDLHLVHGWNVNIGPDAVIGDRVGVMHDVTIGTNMERSGTPRIHDDAFIGTGARLLGPIEIGERARVGANSVVIGNVPADATAMGVPAKILRYTGRPAMADQES